jgi:predicted permease
MPNFLNDLRYSLRQLRKTPGFAVVCILTLALGIGANTAVFTVMNAVLLKSLPVADPERVVYLRTTHSPRNTGTINGTETFSYPVYDTLRRRKGPLAEVMAYVPLSTGKVSVKIGSGTAPEQAEGEMVSGNYFSGLGVTMARGRGFTDEDESNHAAYAVVSYGSWKGRLASSQDVLGKTIAVNGVAITVIGVARQGFEGTETGLSTNFWIPMQDRVELNAWGNPPDHDKLYKNNPRWWCLHLIARLGPGVTRTQAAAALQSTFQSAAYLGIGTPEKGEILPVLHLEEAKSFPGSEENYGKPLRMMMAMVLLVLLIALSNVAMMLMARNSTRQREFSLRMALGAGRGELFRQLLAESLILVTVGGALAWLFANAASHALGTWARIESTLAPDRTVLLFTLGILVAAALIFGFAPLRRALIGGPQLTIKSSAATSQADAGRSRTSRITTVLQMALCVVLLVGAGLLVRSLRSLEQIPLGFSTDGLVVFNVKPKIESLPQGRAFYRRLTEQLRVLPGVESVALSEERLGSWWSDNSDMMVDGKLPTAVNGGSTTVRSNVVGANFFHTIGVPVMEGREFLDSDTVTSAPVGIINERFAKQFFAGRDPIGHTIGTDNGEWTMTVIGVVRDHKYRSIDEEPIPMAWYNYSQIPMVGGMAVEMRVRATDKPLAILPAAQKALAAIDPELPLIEPTTQRAQYETTISQQSLFARLAGFFGLLAVLLVATGLYGTMAYRVNNRTPEIGVRMALGARRGQVVWMVLRESLVLTGFGIVLGVPLAAVVSRVLASNLYGVKSYDLITYSGALYGVLVVALAASAIPARRAAGVDPIQALRSE